VRRGCFPRFAASWSRAASLPGAAPAFPSQLQSSPENKVHGLMSTHSVSRQSALWHQLALNSQQYANKTYPEALHNQFRWGAVVIRSEQLFRLHRAFRYVTASDTTQRLSKNLCRKEKKLELCNRAPAILFLTSRLGRTKRSHWDLTCVSLFQGLSTATKDTYDALQMQPLPPR